jgi:hypothetical protein
VVRRSKTFHFTVIYNDWFAFGPMIAFGETLVGLAPSTRDTPAGGNLERGDHVLDLVRRRSTMGRTAGTGWSFTGVTYPSDDRVLAHVFVALVVAPTAFGIASRSRLCEHGHGSSVQNPLLRFLVD